jgi:DNA polymerase I-like protein with 3'-5' exonuclease and polymerase domains
MRCFNNMKIPKGKRIAIDLETDGLQVYHGNRAFCLGYYTDLNEKGFAWINDASREWLKKLFNDSSKTLIFHNAKFDLGMMQFESKYLDPFKMKAHFDCTLTMSKVLFSTSQNHDLRTLTLKLLHRNPKDKDDIQNWIKENTRIFNKTKGRPPNFHDAPVDLVKRRVMWDAESTLLLHTKLTPQIEKVCPQLYETERLLELVCIDMENTGLLIDITRTKQLRQQAIDDLRQIQADLDNLVCPFVIKRKKKDKEWEETITSLNPGSNALQLPAAFIKVGIPLKYKTEPKKKPKGKLGRSGGGRWAFDEYAMVRYVSKPLAMIIKTSSEEGWRTPKYYKEIYKVLKDNHLSKKELLPPLILKYNELRKMISTYYDHFINDCVNVVKTPTREVGVLHAKLNPSEALTGRFSVSTPPLQQIPRILGPRESFIPRFGRRNWHFDYEQVEMRMFVHFAKDPIMAKAINADIHEAVAAQIYGLPKKKITSEQRKRAKAVNFGIIYGAGAKKIAETLTRRGLPTTEMEGKTIVAQYHRKFPSVRQTTQKLASELRRVGYITNPFGRRYHIPVQFSYKSLNYMCQGTSADLMKKAMVDIWLWLRKNNFKSKMIMTIHDEIVIECVRSEERIILPQIKKFMDDLKTFYVPVTTDMKFVDKRWNHKINPKDVGLDYFKKKI